MEKNQYPDVQNMDESQLRSALRNLQAELASMSYDQTASWLFAPEDGRERSLERLYRDTGVRFSGDRFVLLQFEDDPTCPPAKPEEEGESSFQWRYARLRELILSVLGRDYPTVVCNRNGRIICVLNWQGSEENWHGRISALIDRLNARLFEELGFRFQCVVSRMFTGVNRLAEEERELAKARNYRVLMGGLAGQTLFYDGILRTTGLEDREGMDRDDSALNREFSQAIQRGEIQQAKEIFHQIIRHNFVDSKPAVQFVQLRMFSVIDYLLKTLEKVARDLDIRREMEELNAAPRLLAAENVWKLEEIADQLLEEIGEIFAGNEQVSGLAFHTRNYINEHYSDPNLNVSQVSDVFHVTPTHLTRVFKRQFGMGVLNYIHQVRINTAKPLLSGGATVKEAAEQVGYSSAAILIRAFKKLEGTTPARFGESAERKEES